MAENAYKKATTINIFFLPTLSLNLPEISIAIIAAKEGELTTQPVCMSFRLNSGPTYDITPEIIPASNPNKNPPSETTKAINTDFLDIFKF